MMLHTVLLDVIRRMYSFFASHRANCSMLGWYTSNGVSRMAYFLHLCFRKPVLVWLSVLLLIYCCKLIADF